MLCIQKLGIKKLWILCYCQNIRRYSGNILKSKWKEKARHFLYFYTFHIVFFFNATFYIDTYMLKDAYDFVCFSWNWLRLFFPCKYFCFFFFNCSIIALSCCISLCCITKFMGSQRVRHDWATVLSNKVNQLYVYIYPFPLESPSFSPPLHPSRSPQSTKLSILCYIAASH